MLVHDESINYSIYKVRIKPGILYQPHPCFAKDPQGNFVYHDLTSEQVSQIKTFSFFTSTGTRELTAHDYAFQIKRLAHPQKHSPVLGLMSKYIVGLKELKEKLLASSQKGQVIDLKKFNIAGVKVVNNYEFEIKIYGKYPQFKYWLAMNFFFCPDTMGGRSFLLTDWFQRKKSES